jgi:hypothetical protein
MYVRASFSFMRKPDNVFIAVDRIPTFTGAATVALLVVAAILQ